LSGDAVAGEVDYVTSFRAPFLPTDTDLTVPAIIATMDGSTYCYITAHKNLSNKAVAIPSKYNGWKITTIKGSANVILQSEYVSNNEIVITVSNNYGDVVLKLGN